MQGNLEGRFFRANPQICGLKSPSRRNAVLLGEDVGGKLWVTLTYGCRLRRPSPSVVLRLLRPVVSSSSQQAHLIRENKKRPPRRTASSFTHSLFF